MARQRLIDAPPQNDVYVGMLGLTALAMFAGVVVMLLEFGGDYDFTQEAKGGPAVSLPKDYSRPSPKSDGPAPTPAAAPLTKAPVPPVATPVPREVPPEVPPPAVAATVPPAAVEPVAVPRPAAIPEPVAPASAPAIVRPGFTPRLPR